MTTTMRDVFAELGHLSFFYSLWDVALMLELMFFVDWSGCCAVFPRLDYSPADALHGRCREPAD